MTDFKNRITELKHQGMMRSFTSLSGREKGRVTRDGRRLVNLSSNDYLGLVANKELLEKFYDTISEDNLVDDYALGVGSSRLLTGDNRAAHRLEGLLSSLYSSESCLLFNSGYHANIGIIPALFGKGDLVLSDKLNHASIHDGLRISRADCRRYSHNDYSNLEKLLQRYRSDYGKAVIVSESVFSMDGDCTDLVRLVELKEKYDCLLYLDEAHGIGLYGEKGLGIAEKLHLTDKVDLLVGTFGKACGSVGAFLVCRQEIYDYLVNFSRSLIFTTALPPVVLSWNAFVMKRIPGMKEERENLRKLSTTLRDNLKMQGLETRGETNIIPVIIGSSELTVAGSNYLQDHGFLVMPVRPPTVPSGTSRFRLSLTADLTWNDLETIPKLIAEWLGSQDNS